MYLNRNNYFWPFLFVSIKKGLNTWSYLYHIMLQLFQRCSFFSDLCCSFRSRAFKFCSFVFLVISGLKDRKVQILMCKTVPGAGALCSVTGLAGCHCSVGLTNQIHQLSCRLCYQACVYLYIYVSALSSDVFLMLAWCFLRANKTGLSLFNLTLKRS